MIILRAHKWDSPTLFSYERYSRCDKVVLGFDAGAGHFIPSSIPAVKIDDEWLNESGLNVACPNIMWRCGDYNFYSVYQKFPNEKYYWLIEPDVHINWPDVSDFFKNIDAYDSDFLGLMYGPRGGDWFWHSKISLFYDSTKIHGCSFGIVRLSNHVISKLFEKRKLLASEFLFNSINAKEWPNDESFVVNHLLMLGHKLSDINSFLPGVSFANTYWINKKKGWHEYSEVSSLPDFKIYHPVRGFD